MNKGMPTYFVWQRSDGYVDASCYRPLIVRGDTFKELLATDDWSAARSRIVAERVAILMNEDIWPIQPSAEGNRVVR